MARSTRLLAARVGPGPAPHRPAEARSAATRGARREAAGPRVVVGRVMSADTEEPIPGARVLVRGGPPLPNRLAAFVCSEGRLTPEVLVEGARTDEAGRFRARVFSDTSPVHVSAVHPDRLTTESGPLDAAGTQEPTLRMKSGATLVVEFTGLGSAGVSSRFLRGVLGG